jgi:uncharacterized membrane protein
VKSRARILGHPVHQTLVVFPLGLLLTATILDLWAWATANVFWSDPAFYLAVGGIAGGVVAAPFGLVDWLAIPRGTRARAVGAWHGIGNLVVLGFFAVSAVLRAGEARVGGWPLALALVGTAVALLTAWLGGELVVRLGVGVDPGANVDAPSSLSHERVPEITASAGGASAGKRTSAEPRRAGRPTA